MSMLYMYMYGMLIYVPLPVSSCLLSTTHQISVFHQRENVLITEGIIILVGKHSIGNVNPVLERCQRTVKHVLDRCQGNVKSQASVEEVKFCLRA